jgi:hypothetical protein
MQPLRALAPTLLLAAACGDPLFFAQVKEERLCLALANRSVPAAPLVVAALGPQTVTWTGDLDLGSKFPGLDEKDGLEGSIRVLSMAVTGSTDLSGVTDAQVTVTDAAGASTPFMRYVPTPGAALDRLAMTAEQDLNLLDRLDRGVLHYSISFTGTPPTTAWTAEIENCLTLDVTIDALEAMN